MSSGKCWPGWKHQISFRLYLVVIALLINDALHRIRLKFMFIQYRWILGMAALILHIQFFCWSGRDSYD